MHKHEAAPSWLAAYAERLEAADLPPSYPADRGDADRAVRLPSGRELGEEQDAETAGRGTAGSWATPDLLEQQARALADELGIKFGHLVAPIRAALSGTNKGPGLFDIVYLLGKERCVARLRARAS